MRHPTRPVAPRIVILAITLTVIACSLLSCKTSPAGYASADQKSLDRSISALERRLYLAVEHQRRQSARTPLHRLSSFDAIAREHSYRMAQSKVDFGHRGSKARAKKVGEFISASTIGENVARNRGYDDPVAIAVEGWMKSRGHRRNILGKYDVTGVGVAEANDGTLFFTQVFAARAE